MNNIQIFKNKQFGEVRVIEQNGEPWFVGKDVAEILGYSDTNKAVAMHVDDEDKKLNDKSSSSFGQRGAHLINESGLYSLILSSKLPQAKQFKRWVTSEVLPSIRKHGGYINGQESMTDEELLSKALIMAQSKIEEKTRQIERMKPKEIFADAVTASHNSILVGELAKVLRQNGIEIGQNRLFEWLRGNGYLIKRKGLDWNMPTQMAMELGLFEIKETVITHADGHTSVNKTVKVTGKGQQYFINKFLGVA
jgi:anti-repressor protein|nr:MAG TPA: repressor domain protein [Caudoviricetes sp.]